MVALSIVESKPFKRFIYSLEPRYQMPTQKQLTTVLLKQRFDDVFIGVKNLLKDVKELSLTMDIWSNRQMRSYCGITAHFIKNWEMFNVMLICNRFKGRHTGESIFQEYESTISTFEITSKVKHIITDHAANMLKAFNLPGFTQESEEEDDFGDDEDVNIDEHVTREVVNTLPAKHHGCFAHSLQLVIKDGFKNASQISRVISKCSKIVSHVRKSTIATEILDDQKKLEIANATRWNSQLKMIRSILAVDQEKLDSISDAPKLTTYERKNLADLIEILTPFEEATDFSQTENQPSAGYVIPCICGLKHQLKSMITTYNCSLFSVLKESVERRFSVYEADDLYHIAAIVDPCFKLLWCDSEEEKEDMKKLLSDFAADTYQMPCSDGQDLCGQSGEEGPEASAPKRRKTAIFSFMEDSQQQDHRRASSSKPEILKYLEELVISQDNFPLVFWKQNNSQFPILAHVAECILAIPASSAPVERLFSIAGKIFRPDRCRISDENFHKLVFIRSNNSIIPHSH